jgi:hypothetical protein
MLDAKLTKLKVEIDFPVLPKLRTEKELPI